MTKCSVCGKQKLNLTFKSSELMPKTNFYYCNDDLDKEPRYIVIIVGRQDRERVKPYLDGHRYVGALITESDLN